MQLYHQSSFYQGKVRDVYGIGEDYILMQASDRISAFDHILPREIPYKGQVLNQTAAYFLKATEDIIQNWYLDSPSPNSSIGYKCIPLPIEVVVRGNLAGHALREYQSGAKQICGIPFPEGIKPNEAFPTAIITPTTKAHSGHDEDITRDEIINRGIIDNELYKQMEERAYALFHRGREMAAEVGLLLVDTKYEFGLYNEELILMDEIHTPDSSRYWELDGLDEKIAKGEAPEQLSKEFVREWLMENGFQGKEGQQIPEMTDEVVNEISQRYIDLYKRLTQKDFEKMNLGMDEESVINKYLKEQSY